MAEPTATQQPTPSTQTNKLLDLCRAVLSGEPGKLNELNLYLQERVMALDQARASFLEAVAAEGEAFAAAFRESIDAVLETFEQVAEAQGTLAMFLKDRQPVRLERGIDQLIQATNNMYVAVTHYESRYAQTGPSQFPVLNFFTKAVASLKAGEMSSDDFRVAADGGRQFFEKAVEEIDQSSKKDEKGVPERREACLLIIQAFQQMERNLGENDLLELDLRMLEEGFAKLEAALKLYQQGAFMETPTESPFVNWVIHAAEGVKAGLYPSQVLKEALDFLESNVREARRQFESSAQVPVSSALLQDEIPRTLEAFDLHDEAIAQMRATLPGPTPEQLDAGIAALSHAVSSLKGSADVYQNVADREGKVLCPRCGEPNLPDLRVCTKCSGPLPRVADPQFNQGAASTFEVRETDEPRPEQAPDMVMTNHLKRLFDACEAIEQKQITAEEFLEVIDWAEGLLEQGESQLESMPRPGIPTGLSEEEEQSLQEQIGLVDETVELLEQGIQEFRSGLDVMRTYVDKRQRDTLVTGIRVVWEGSQKIYQVQRMGQLAEQIENEPPPEPQEE